MTATIYIRVKRGTAASFTAANPVLEAGQPAYETDTRKLKVGDGSTAWVSLAYISTPGTISDGDKGDITASSLGAVWTIDNGAVTLAKQANVASGTLFYRKTVGAGAPEVQTLATLKTDLALGLSDVSGLTAALAAKQPLDGDLTSLAAAAGTNDIYYRSAADTWSPVAIGANLTFTAGTLAATGGGGVSDGDKGDITVSSSGAVWTIDNGVVTLAKQADMATASLVYRKTAGTGVPEVQTLATLKTDLGLTGTNSGDQTITLTGEVTGTGTGSFATTIAANAVTYAKMQDTALGNVVLGKSGAAGDITEIQLGLNNLLGRGSSGNLTTITLDATLGFTGAVLGVVAGTYSLVGHTHTLANVTDVTMTVVNLNSLDDGVDSTLHFHDADRARANHTGTQAIATVTGLQAALDAKIPGPGAVTDNALVRFDGTTGLVVQNSPVTIDDNGMLGLPAITPSAPSSGLNWGAFSLSGLILPGFMQSGMVAARALPMDWRKFGWYGSNSTTYGLDGAIAMSPTGTGTSKAWAATNVYTRAISTESLVTTPATNAVAGYRSTTAIMTVGGAGSGQGGFYWKSIWGPATGVSVSTTRAFWGVRALTSGPSDVEPSGLVNMVGMGWDAADTNIQMMHNDGSGAATKIDLGASFPRPAVDRTELYSIELFSVPGTTQSVVYRVVRLSTGSVATGTISTDLPSTGQILTYNTYLSVGGTSSVIGVALERIETYLFPETL